MKKKQKKKAKFDFRQLKVVQIVAAILALVTVVGFSVSLFKPSSVGGGGGSGGGGGGSSGGGSSTNAPGTSLDNPKFANSIEECVDTSKYYVLPDGYIYAYMTKTVTGIEEVVVDVTEGFEDNTRLSVSSGNTSSLSGYVTTPFIDFSQYPIDAEIRLSGISWAAEEVNTTGYAVVTYDDNKAMLCPFYLYLGEHSDSTINEKYIAESYTDVVFTVRDVSLERNFKYVRFSGNGTSENAVVEIVYKEEGPPQTVSEWSNTGIAFASDHEDRIIELEEGVQNHNVRLEFLEANAGNGGIPAYWLEELEGKADAIQQAMESAGRNKSAFLWYTDAHWDRGNSKMSPLLLEYLVENTSMNKVNFGGDIIADPTALTHEKIKSVYEWREAVDNLPNHHCVIGNHDNLHMTVNDSDVSDLVYSFLIAPDESSDMVMGGDFCYYIDNSCEKTRYLYLDSGRIYLNEDEVQFIIDSLASVQSGWHVVVISHVWFQYTNPSNPTDGEMNAHMQVLLNLLDAYNSRGTGNFSLSYPSVISKPYDFTNSEGRVEFCIGGHVHVDMDLSSDDGIPVILTASDANQERSSDEEEDSGKLGTTTESAVFGIIADYTDQKITVVGVGRGTSRVISY